MQGTGDHSQSIQDIERLKQSGSYPLEDMVVMSPNDYKNNTMETIAGDRAEKKEKLTALWKGQSTLATMTSNPLKSSMFRASTV